MQNSSSPSPSPLEQSSSPEVCPHLHAHDAHVPLLEGPTPRDRWEEFDQVSLKKSKWSKSQRLFRWQNNARHAHTFYTFTDPLTQTGATLVPRAAPRRHQSHWLANALQPVPAMRCVSCCFILLESKQITSETGNQAWIRFMHETF